MKSRIIIFLGLIATLNLSCNLPKVDPSPSAEFEIIEMSNSGYAPSEVIFQNTSDFADDYVWDFGDPSSGANNISTEENPKHLYQSAGTYTVSLTAIYSRTGEEDVFTKEVMVQTLTTDSPVAGFEVDSMTNNGFAPSTVAFQNTSSNADVFAWDFGDPDSGAGNFSATQHPSHLYQSPGTYSVTLTATNSLTEEEDEISLNVTVLDNTNEDPVASFEVGFQSNMGFAPSDISFVNNSQNTDTYFWNFGDPTSGANNTSTEEHPTHTFNFPGMYTVTLTATNSATSEDDEYSLDVFVVEVPTCESTFGGSENDWAWSIVQSASGTLALTGTTHSYATDVNDFYLLLTDQECMEISSSILTFAKEKENYAYSIIATESGGWAMTGRTFNSIGDGDFFFVLTDANGNELPGSGKTYGGSNNDSGQSIAELSSGGFAMVGYSKSFGVYNKLYLVLTDASGNQLSEKTFGGQTNHDRGYDLVATQDGRIAMAGATSSLGQGGDAYLVITDLNGNLLSESNYGGSGYEYFEAIIETQEGGFAMVGYTTSFGATDADIYLVVTDGNGNTLPGFPKLYGGGELEFGYDLVQTQEGGFAIVGKTQSFGAGGEDVYLILTDANGNELPSSGKTYGGSGADTGHSIVQTQDGGFAIGGRTDSFGNNDQVYLIKTDKDGNVN